MTGTRSSFLFLDFKQGYASHSNGTCHKVFEEKKSFFEIFSFFLCNNEFCKELNYVNRYMGGWKGICALEISNGIFFQDLRDLLSKKT